MSSQEKKNGHVRVAKSPFGYFGSKHKLALPIIKYLPPHNAWVEAFCGSAAVTLAKDPVQIEVINDINSEIINFFSQLRKNSSRLCKLVELTPYAREELDIARHDKKKVSDLERARRFLVSSMMAINGVFGEAKGGFSYSNSYSRSGMEARVSRWCNVPKRLEAVVERLKHTRIENQDARHLIKDFINRPATLIYLDPPYLGQRSQGYDHDQNDEKFHKELLELICQAHCMIMISSYDNDLYSSILKPQFGWEKVQIATHTQGSNGKRITRTEILWLNELCIQAKKAGRIDVLNEKEKAMGKVNPVKGNGQLALI